MSLQSFQKAYQKISQLNQFLISMTYGLFTRTAVKIELGHAAIPQLLQSSTKFVLSNMLYFNSTNRLHNNKRDIQHLVFTLQPFLLCGENAGKNPKIKNRLTYHNQQIKRFYWYPEPGSNRHGHYWPQDFKSGVSTDSTIRAQSFAERRRQKYENIYDLPKSM